VDSIQVFILLQEGVENNFWRAVYGNYTTEIFVWICEVLEVVPQARRVTRNKKQKPGCGGYLSLFLGFPPARLSYQSGRLVTSAEVKKMWIYTSTPHTPSWRSA
jgi:hypothetical protein